MAKLGKSIQRFSITLIKYLAAAVLIFIPLYPKFPLFFLPKSAVAVRAEDFLIAVSFVALGTYLFFNRPKKLPPMTYQIGVFFFVGLVSCLSAILITHTASPTLSLLHWGRRIEYMFVFYLIYFVGIQSYEHRRFLIELLLLPPIGVFLYGIAQMYFHAPVISTMNVEFSKGAALQLQPGVNLNSTFAGHYDLALYLSMILVFLTALFYILKNKWERLGVFLGYLIFLWLFAQAGSRISLIGVTFALLVVAFFFKRLKEGLIFVALVGSSLLFSPNLIRRLNNLINVFKSKFLSFHIIKPAYAQEDLRPIELDVSSSIRFDVEWPRAFRSFFKNPFFGTGYSSMGLATDNDYLRALGEIGFLGLGAFISILVRIFTGLRSRFNKVEKPLDRLAVAGGIGVFIIFLVSAIFLDVFESSKIAIMFWAFLGLAFSVNSNAKKTSK